MVAPNTFKFQEDPLRNTQTVDRITTAFEELHPGRTVAVTHEIRGTVARVRFSLVPIMDEHSENLPNFELGVVEVPVETELTEDQLFNEPNDTMKQLEEREVA